MKRKQEVVFLALKHRAYKMKKHLGVTINKKSRIFLMAVSKVVTGKWREMKEDAFWKVKKCFGLEVERKMQLAVLGEVFGGVEFRILGASFCTLKLAAEKRRDYLFELPLLADKLSKM